MGTEQGNQFNRRDFVRLSTAGLGIAAGLSAAKAQGQSAPDLGPAPEHPFSVPALDRVRVGYVGAGGMGTNHIKNLLRIEGVELTAVCDIVPEKCENVQKLAKEAGFKEPKAYSKGERDFERMCEQEELDLVYTATPWQWHTPVCVAAMKNGKHAATEVNACVTIEECWQLVENAEKFKKHCVMMENCCYDRFEMMTLVMVRKGLLGELVHAECGYLHDLREVKFGKESEGLWRRAHAIARNGNLYPTHGLGPVSQCLNINRGDQYEYMVSMSSMSRGLQDWQKEHLDKDDPRRNETYKLGDVNTSMIKTYNGATITLVHDTNLPRPYSRIHELQGTRGIVQKWPVENIYIEGRSPKHEWEESEEYYKEFEHPLQKSMAEKAKGAGHGGMDFIEDWRLIYCLRNGLPTDADVYDAASWSSVIEASEKSVANKSQAIDLPDFTRGKWKTNKPLDIVTV